MEVGAGVDPAPEVVGDFHGISSISSSKRGTGNPGRDTVPRVRAQPSRRGRGRAALLAHLVAGVSRRVAGVLSLIVRGRERLGARITCLVRHLEADEPTCSSTRSAAASLLLRLHQVPHLVVQRPHPVLDLRRAREQIGRAHV